jgi:hypothetical protein
MRHEVQWVFIDNSYNARKNEVIEQCISGIMKGSVPCYGRDGLKTKYGRECEFHPAELRDPYEGTAKGGRWKLLMVTHNPNLLKNTLFLLSTGRDWHAWRIPEDVKQDYIAQMQSERCTDGAWMKVKSANHIWDCETMQLLAAKLLGFWTENPVMAIEGSVEQIPAATLPVTESVKPPKPSEPAPERCKGCGSRGMYQKNNVWMCPVCDKDLEEMLT